MDGMTSTDTLSQCRVRHYHECGQTRENVTCDGVLFTQHDVDRFLEPFMRSALRL